MSLENSDDDSKAGWLNNWENSKISDEELAQEVAEVFGRRKETPSDIGQAKLPEHVVQEVFPLSIPSNKPTSVTYIQQNPPAPPQHRPMDDFSLEQKKSIQELESHIAQNQADEEEPGYDQALSSIEQERYVNAWRMKQNDR